MVISASSDNAFDLDIYDFLKLKNNYLEIW